MRDVPPAEILAHPESYQGKLFVFGGIIAQTKVTEEGSLIEALYVPVDSKGALKQTHPYQGRFYALYPKEKGILDPMIYHAGKKVTLAGEFIGAREGRLDETRYTYPMFKITAFYLWEERSPFYYPDFFDRPLIYYPPPHIIPPTRR